MTITDLRPEVDDFAVPAAALDENTRGSVALVEGRDEQAHYHFGHAAGLIYAAALDKGDDARDIALARIAECRQTGAGWTAHDAETALRHYYSGRGDADARRLFARASGVLYAFSLATDSRPDAHVCANCGAAVLTDVMADAIACTEHGITCDDICADERHCGDHCRDDGR